MAGSACGSKTSSSPPTPARSASTTRRAISRSSADGRRSRVKLDGATFLLQWATGGLLFCWVTTRHRQVSLGYGWLLRSVYGVMAVGAVALFASQELTTARSLALAGSVGVVLGAALALLVSVVRRRAGVRGREEVLADRRARRSDGRARGDGDAGARAACRVPARARPDRARARCARVA